MSDFLQKQTWELRRSMSLRFFGILLFIGHIFTFMRWFSGPDGIAARIEQDTIICWSLIPKCETFGLIASQTWLQYFYVGAAAVGILCLMLNIGLGLAWWLLLIDAAIMFIAYAADMSLAANIFPFLIFAHVVYLFLPSKPQSLRILILAYYIFDGLLKLNAEWLSGYWVGQNIDLPSKYLEWVAAVAVMAVLILPVILFSKKGVRFGWAAFSLILFHLLEWIFVADFFAPAISIGFVLFFTAYFFEMDQRHRETLYQSFTRPEPTKVFVPVLFVVFAAIQATNFMPATSELTMPLRMEPKTVPPACQSYAFAYFADQTREIDPDSLKGPSGPNACEKDVHLQRVKKLCGKMQLDHQNFKTIASYFLIRPYGQGHFDLKFSSTNVCGGSHSAE